MKLILEILEALCWEPKKVEFEDWDILGLRVGLPMREQPSITIQKNGLVTTLTITRKPELEPAWVETKETATPDGTKTLNVKFCKRSARRVNS